MIEVLVKASRNQARPARHVACEGVSRRKAFSAVPCLPIQQLHHAKEVGSSALRCRDAKRTVCRAAQRCFPDMEMTLGLSWASPLATTAESPWAGQRISSRIHPRIVRVWFGRAWPVQSVRGGSIAAGDISVFSWSALRQRHRPNFLVATVWHQ